LRNHPFVTVPDQSKIGKKIIAETTIWIDWIELKTDDEIPL
jgi:hypothetical protein